MKKVSNHSLVIAALILVLFLSACATTAQTQFYRPANYSGEPFRIAGVLEPLSGLTGVVKISINENTVIEKKLPMFTTTTDATGTYDGKKISATITKVKTFLSSYIRADVFVGAEKAATLTF